MCVCVCIDINTLSLMISCKVALEMERDLPCCLELKRYIGLLLWKCFALLVNANYIKTKSKLKN